MKLTIELEYAQILPTEAREFLRSAGVEPDGSRKGSPVDCVLVRVDGELRSGVAFDPVYKRWAPYDHLEGRFREGGGHQSLSSALSQLLHGVAGLGTLAERADRNFQLMKAGHDSSALPDVEEDKRKAEAKTVRVLRSVREFCSKLRDAGDSPLLGDLIADQINEVVAVALTGEEAP